MRSISAGSSIAAMIFRLPPHCGQRSISMSNTRLSKRAQLRRAEAPCAWAQSAAGAGLVSAAVGTIAARSLACSASTPVKADQMQARARHESCQPLHEFERRHHDMARAVAIRRLELQHDLPRVVHAQPLGGDRRARDVAAQVLKLAAHGDAWFSWPQAWLRSWRNGYVNKKMGAPSPALACADAHCGTSPGFDERI